MPNNSFRKVKVDKRSGFDKSYRNTLTGKCGTLVPILVDEIMPDTKIHLKEAIAVSLPPLVSDTYMNVRLRVEAFVVPHRLTYANFEDFFKDYPVEGNGSPTNAPVPTDSSDYDGCMPLIRVNSAYPTAIPSDVYKNGSLCDYFGIPAFDDHFDFDVVAAPFVAYHLIWNEWYRNPRVQKSCFVPALNSIHLTNSSPSGAYPSGIYYAAFAPYYRSYFGAAGVSGAQATMKSIATTSEGVTTYDLQPYVLHDGVDITDLRQRNFGLDFFTAAMVEPQQGPQAKVEIVAGAGGAADSFTIASLRVQNSMQQFRERNNLTSPRYQQQLYARYGVAPDDGIIQRPVLIGAQTFDVYSHGVVAQAYSDTAGPNPFNGQLGARGGNGFAAGSDFLIENFHAKEPMYLIVLASLVPEVSYSQNFNPLFLRYKGLGSISDMANGILQNVGPQPIPKGVLGMASSEIEFNDVFAYTDRYSDWMIRNNEVHGEMKEYQYGSLSAFVLQRTFSDLPEFGSEFLEIPTTYLDGVMQASTAVMGLTYWMDISFEYKVSMPLQEYAIPSLQDPGYEHGRTITLRKNGQLL